MHGISEGATNTPGAQNGNTASPANVETAYIVNTNLIIFTNVLITNGVLDVGIVTNMSGSYAAVNGLTLQLIQPYVPFTMAMSNTYPVLTYGGGSTLMQATNILGPWTPVAGAAGGWHQYIHCAASDFACQ